MHEPPKAPDGPALDAAALVALLRRHRFPASAEPAMHAALKKLLAKHAIRYLYEMPLDKANRPDFLTWTAGHQPELYTLIELKARGGSDAEIMRQLVRYALTGKAAVIILIIARHFSFHMTHLEGPANRPIPFHVIRPTL